MRPDQFDKLNALSAKLAEVVLVEADPDNWPAAGVMPAEQTRQERGDRYWAKKSAAATLALLTHVERLTSNTREALGRDPYQDDDLDKQIACAEREAAMLLDKMALASRKSRFDRRVHGKA